MKRREFLKQTGVALATHALVPGIISEKYGSFYLNEALNKRAGQISRWELTLETNGPVHAFVVKPQGGESYLFAGTSGVGGGSLYQSKNNNRNESWAKVSEGLQGIIREGGLTADGENPYVATLGIGGGLFRSTDNGENWKKTNMPAQNAYSVSIHKNKIFVGTQNSVFYSIDDGRSWQEVNDGLPKVTGANLPIYSKAITQPENIAFFQPV